MSRSQATKRRRYEGKDAELLKQVSTHLVTGETLREKLAQHVEQVRISFLVIWSITKVLQQSNKGYLVILE